MKPFFKPTPVIFARRGGMPSLPADSPEAYHAAIASGAHVITATARLSADNELVLVRENNVLSMTGIDKNISDMTLAEIKSLDAAYTFKDPLTGEYSYRGKGISFMTLKEALEKFPDQRFNVELMDKGKALPAIFCDIIEEFKAVDRILVYCSYGSSLRIVRKRLPSSATSLSLMGIIGIYALFRTGFLYFTPGFRADVLQVPEMIGPSFIGNQALIRESSAKGIRIIISLDDSPVQVKRLYESGAHGFITNNVPALTAVLDEIPV
ncbi:MAG TPA: glycerophosphodiester phosphodiesterase family protein [Spirochaetota bacterium]|nr:glycerophosphodiester phosphodiesterase family protein [Spirochaetota bacterium]HPI89248.1 glycerophosphodiester phosphodiesterase family protein [Spirochaetota bacterium]HPR48592.1 glycerophosphodiester phosphodiesterase family protein [Spirochaetota bacterium]